jgi:hypothetical protein
MSSKNKLRRVGIGALGILAGVGLIAPLMLGGAFTLYKSVGENGTGGRDSAIGIGLLGAGIFARSKLKNFLLDQNIKSYINELEEITIKRDDIIVKMDESNVSEGAIKSAQKQIKNLTNNQQSVANKIEKYLNSYISSGKQKTWMTTNSSKSSRSMGTWGDAMKSQDPQKYKELMNMLDLAKKGSLTFLDTK